MPPEPELVGEGVLEDVDGVGVGSGQEPRREKGGTLPVPGIVAETWWDGDDLLVEELVARLSDNGGGTSGETVLDVRVGGVSIFDTTTEDLRPRFAFDAAELEERGAVPHRAVVRAGERVELWVVEESLLGILDAVRLNLVGWSRATSDS